ncbi:DNA cytosine methyltransferase [Priestia aryabhattai]|uniref:DNA cytosine methyltransferase n=1 Tax=Priestia aryabhattai TaxID=412384 RepID=A0AAX6NE45_PRIAR|nr:DNA cytosine methyltransferase [Priestia aryabhattai]MDU9693764.1 DNA cytosine methyltransferase [Priestia aryabhattai]
MTNINEIKAILSKKVSEEKSGKRTIDLPPITYKKNKISHVSLFCGAGGMDLGTIWAALEVGMNKRVSIAKKEEYDAMLDNSVIHTVYAIDYLTEQVNTYSMNFKDTLVHKADITKLKNFPKADLYTFGFPCPGYVRQMMAI